MWLRRRLWVVNGYLWLLVAVPSVVGHVRLAVLRMHRVRCIVSVRVAELLVHVWIVHIRLVVVRLIGIVMVRKTPTPAAATVAVMSWWMTLTAISNRSMTVPKLVAIGSTTTTTSCSSSLRGWLPSRQVVAHLAGLGGDGSQCWSLPATIHLDRADPEMWRLICRM